MSTHLVVGGERGSGKSTLTVSLFTQLTQLGVAVGLHEIDVYSDTHSCILRKKPWEKRIKKKHAWFRPTIYRRIQEYANDQRTIVLGDLPGKITNPFLGKMVEPADQAIIVAKSWSGLTEWSEYFEEHRIPVVLRVISHLGQLPLLPEGTTDIHYVQGLNRTVHLNGEVRTIAHKIRKLCARPVGRTG